jgi:tetratricopeptide (TPR) repeat protein
MQFTFDNSSANPRNPQLPPRRVLWGQRSFDEMGDLWLQVTTRSQEERAVLYRAIRPKMAAESLKGYEMLIRTEPGRASLHDDAALLARELGRPDQEVAHFEASLRLKPQSAAAHQNLGAALADAGRLDAAIQHYQTAVVLDPDHAVARTNFGRALIRLGRLAEAADQYRHAIRVDPRSAPAHNDLGYILLERGDVNGALDRFREAARLEPGLGDAHYNLGRALRRLAAFSDAIDHFRRAVDLTPEWPPALANLAWLLATAPPSTLRLPDTAVALAERAAALTSRRDPAVLDVLAAAYAAAGRFDRALEAVVAAGQLLRTDASIAIVRARERSYRSGSPYRLPEDQVPAERDLLAPLR